MGVLGECVISSLGTVSSSIGALICCNVLYNILVRAARTDNTRFHIVSTVVGLCLLYFHLLHVYIVFFLMFIVMTYFWMSVLFYLGRPIGLNMGHGMLSVVIFYLVFSEYRFPNAAVWLQLRGILMVATMKVVTLSFDLNNLKVPLPSFLSYTGFICCPANVVFGPVCSYKEYLFIKDIPYLFNDKWIIKVFGLFLLSLLYVCVSTCIEVPYYRHGLLAAYIIALSFRSSHYFVSILSEATMIAAGYNSKGPNNWGFTVCKPLYIEFPRSLATVVQYWNVPMHLFLKEYIYKTFAKTGGKLLAVVGTYFVSSLLHGLNPEITVVLMTLSIFSCIQLRFRNKLAASLSACVRVHKCHHCRHEYTDEDITVRCINMFFTILATIDLIYLGVVMDGIGQKNEISIMLTLQYAIAKWENLMYISHITNGILLFLSFYI